MDNLEITETDQYVSKSSAPKGFYKIVIDLGLAKDSEGAKAILIMVSIVCLALAVMYPFFFR